VETTGAFLNALVSQDNMGINKVRGLKNGILVHNRDTGIPLHVLPNQYLLYRGDTRRYFPNNKYQEEMTKKQIGNSFYGAFAHKNARLNRTKTKASVLNPKNKSFPHSEAQTILMLMMAPLGSLRVSSRVSLFCCPNLNNLIPKRARTLSPVDQEALNQLEQVVQEMEEECEEE